ncbi:MAG: Sapep family Mn(2+)-dependent dipeptidase [Oscillospiraceae bacterium]|jgi:succinyl-diaminopimelate desuccinylase|nr:Sapep family Mn(2+)-dependent dipeptidase [Oscillospiraceae bacterium]
MDRELHAKALDWLKARRADIVADISRLVSIRSVADYNDPPYPMGSGCKRVLDEALRLGEERGFIARNYEEYCGSLCLKDEGPFIGFWGHLDVVPEGADWEIAKPYEPIERDGFLVGRGVADNKGPTVGTMYVIRCLNELGVPLKHNLKLFLGIDEEHGMKDAEYYASHYESPDFTLVADSGYPVSYGEKGIISVDLWSEGRLSDTVVSIAGGVASNVVPAEASCVLKRVPSVEQAIAKLPQSISAVNDGDTVILTAHGTAAHSAGPDKGVNAIWLIMRALVDTHALSPEDEAILAFPARVNDTTDGKGVGIDASDEMSGALTCSGTMAALKDGRVKLHLNIRYPVTADGADLTRRIAAYALANRFALDNATDSKPAYYPRESPVVDALTAVYNDIAGKDSKPFVMSGGTYARKIPRAVGYGPGGFDAPQVDWLNPGHGGVHGPDEVLHIDSLIQAMAVLAMGVVEADRMV